MDIGAENCQEVCVDFSYIWTGTMAYAVCTGLVFLWTVAKNLPEEQRAIATRKGGK